MGLRVASPMCMNLPSAVMLGRMVIWMRVDERSAEGCSLDRQREREGNNLPHDVPIVRDSGRRVKGAGSALRANP